MGQKKRSLAARQVAPSAPPLVLGIPENGGSPLSKDTEQCQATSGHFLNAAGGAESAKTKVEGLSNAKGECEKALVALRRGNSSKALKLIRDACNRYESSALVQRIRGHICMRLASVIEDATTKERHFKEAIDAARKAVLLSPQSIEHAQFYAQLLFEAATESKGYEEVEQECQRALSIQNPLDPAKESIIEEQKLPTPEARIAQVQQDLRGLVQKANIASLSNWMKTLGNGSTEERLRFIHMRKLVEEPMEQRILQAKRPHEVKKSVKTPEEIRKEIEVRVAAARLLQQKRECSSPQSDDGVASYGKGGIRLERRKSSGLAGRKLHQMQVLDERIDRIKAFWNAIQPKERENMLEVRIESLKNYFGSSKVSLAAGLLSEALEFAEAYKTWRFWGCCSCGEKFIDSQEHAQHIMEKHIDSLPPKLQMLLPSEIDQDMVEQITDEDCRPIDGPSAIEILIKSSQEDAENVCADGQFSSAVSVTHAENLSNTVESCLESPANGAIGDTACETDSKDSLGCVGDEEQGQHRSSSNGHLCDGKCRGLKSVQCLVRDIPSYKLPHADDFERTKLLQKIYSLFRTLVRSKCLASEHLEKIVQYAIDELQTLVPDTSLQYEFNHSPLYIRFLPAAALHRVLRYLRELATACGLDNPTDTRASSVLPNEEDDAIPDRLFLSEDFTTLSLDERLLKDVSVEPAETSVAEITEQSVKQGGFNNGVDAHSSQPLPLMVVKDGESLTHTDLQLVWIYGIADYEHQPGSWKQLRETRAQQSRDSLTALEKEILTLQSLCERKREHLHYEMAVSMAEALCIEELKKREMKGDGTFRCLEAVLKDRQRELIEAPSHDLSSQQKLELEVITTIIRDAQSVTVRPFSYENTISVSSSKLLYAEEDDEDAWRVQEFVPQTDSCVEIIIQRLKERCSSEVNKLDARILRVMSNVQHLEQKHGNLSVLDYRAALLPLIKTFIKARLEELAEKDALEKSDAAQEAFLAELSRDGERRLGSLKQTREKQRDKKKSRENRRSRDGKRILDIQQTNCTDGNLVDDSSENAYVDEEDALEWDEIDGLRQEEEAEGRRLAVIEAEERKLAETLELQRRVEEEAKKKQLAKLKQKLAECEGLKLHAESSSEFDDSSCSSVRQLAVVEAEERKLAEALELQCRVEEEAKEKHLAKLKQKLAECECLKLHAESSLEFDDSSCSSSGIPAPLMQTLSDSNDLLGGSAHISPVEYVDSVQSGENAIGGLVTPSSLHNVIRMSVEQPKKGLNDKEAIYATVQDLSVRSSSLEAMPEVQDLSVISSSGGTVTEVDRPLNKPATTSAVDTTDLLSRPKRSGKNRRKRSGRTQEDANPRISKEEQSTAARALELSKRASADTGNSMHEGKGAKSVSVQACSSKNPSKTLRELKAEQDDEERFQADLEQAMRQSLDSSLGVARGENFQLPEPDSLRRVSEEVGKGLENANGQYNCFLNVVIQSLWHVKQFREQLLLSSSINHLHVGVPCVVCALRDIFIGLNAPTSNTNNVTIAPTMLRIALSTLYSQKDFFQEAQMNDASEVLLVVFDCLHKAFSVRRADDDTDARNGVGFWECQACTRCIAHKLFGLDIAMQMNCTGCELESRHLKYTSFFHTIHASALRAAKMYNPGSSLDELLRFVDMSHRLACDKDVGGCGKLNHIHYLLREAPNAFITVLGWQNNRECLEDIIATVDALEVDLDVGVVYCGLDEGYKHRLVSVICYYGQHYHCFAFNHEVGRWVMFDDATVKVIGKWEDVIDTCHRGHLQPQVLFYEALRS